jgi:hypothetical protein
MLVHDAKKQRPGVLARMGLAGPHRARRTVLQLLVLVLVFLAGAFVQRVGAIGHLREAVGMSNASVAAILDDIRHPRLAIESRLHATKLPVLRVDMAYEHYDRIRQKRDEALGRGILFAEDDDMVPATIQSPDGEDVRVRMRLKGDLMDHLGSDKWSYRIQTRGDAQLFGMRRFSIQHPVTRNYLSEWGWLENLRMEGLLAPRYFFIDVVFNGSALGIYAVEEHFSRELLESQGRREGVIVVLEEAHYWARRDRIGQEPMRFDFVQLGGFRNNLVEARRSSRVANDSLLARQRDAAIGLLRAFQQAELPASEVFDAELFGRFLALTDLWEARHGLLWNNLNFYYNPVTARLEPIGFNGDAQQVIDATLYSLVRPLTSRALQDPEVARHYVQTLQRISRPEYLAELRDRFGAEYRGLRLALVREFPDARARDPWAGIERKQALIRQLLEPTRTTLALVTGTTGSGSFPDSLLLEVRNALTLPVEIVAVQLGSETFEPTAVWIGGGGRASSAGGTGPMMLAGGSRDLAAPLEYARFRIPVRPTVAAGQDPREQVRLVTRIIGFETADTVPVLRHAPALAAGALPRLPSVDDALRRHAFLTRGPVAGTLLVRPGVWDVTSDLLVPDGVTLHAGPGTTLRFASDAILFTRAPLHFQGSDDAPVVLAPQDSSWPGLVVLGARAGSTWEHVEVRATRGVERGGWIMTGGITFYESPIQLLRTRILGSTAEDAINVIHGEFSFRDCEFANTVSDAFDGDFVEGEIENCRFAAIAGDAIDVSGSRIIVRNVVFENIGDKAISAGEDSRVDAFDLRMRTVSIGVASKDLSLVRVEGATIEAAVNAGFAAYVKKPEYGVARIEATGIRFLDASPRAIVATGNTVQLNGELLRGTDLDVRALYQAGILGN